MTYKVTTLDKFATIQGGYAYKTNDFQTMGNWPVLKIKNVRTGSIDYSDVVFVSDHIAETTNQWKTKAGDVLISMTGSGPSAPASLVGRVAKVRAGEPVGLINQRVGRLLVKDGVNICLSFLYYVLSQKETQHFLVTNSTGSANQVNISGKTIGAVPCPDLDFQTSSAISDFLDSLEARIDLLRETNATLEAIAQALFKSWFVDFDPVRAKYEGKLPEGMDEATAALFPNSFENSTLGEIPKGWEIKNLGQVAYNVKSRIKNAEDWKNLDLLDLSRMPRKILFPFEYGKGKELSTSVFEFKKDDCLFGAVRPYFHKVCHATRNGVTNSSVLVIRSVVPENQFFVNLVASSKKCVTHATSYSQGTKMPTINRENLSRFSIVCPPDNLQSIFCKYVSPFFKKALNNSLIINLLTELRDALLPRLVMGQLKLPDSLEINNKIKVKA